MRMLFAILALMLTLGATLPAYAAAAGTTDNDAAYRAEAGGGGR
jgi:hypothetical protein